MVYFLACVYTLLLATTVNSNCKPGTVHAERNRAEQSRAEQSRAEQEQQLKQRVENPLQMVLVYFLAIFVANLYG